MSFKSPSLPRGWNQLLAITNTTQQSWDVREEARTVRVNCLAGCQVHDHQKHVVSVSRWLCISLPLLIKKHRLKSFKHVWFQFPHSFYFVLTSCWTQWNSSSLLGDLILSLFFFFNFIFWLSWQKKFLLRTDKIHSCVACVFLCMTKSNEGEKGRQEDLLFPLGTKNVTDGSARRNRLEMSIFAWLKHYFVAETQMNIASNQ